jgi:hypothetical protein
MVEVVDRSKKVESSCEWRLSGFIRVRLKDSGIIEEYTDCLEKGRK